jgi:TetR/AcrR family transcriptional regulator, regulator of autoinduction and epiphytic fitness
MTAAVRVDGRHARAVRTREAIVAAVLELVAEHGVAPTGVQIAEKAGVALRSIGQHFASREELLLAAAEVHMREVARVAKPVDPALPLAARVTAFAAARAKELEATAAVRRASTRFEATSPAVAEAFAVVARARRKLVTKVFATEVRARPELADLLDAVAGARTWDAMRRDQGHSAPAAEKRLVSLLRAVLASP